MRVLSGVCVLPVVRIVVCSVYAICRECAGSREYAVCSVCDLCSVCVVCRLCAECHG